MGNVLCKHYHKFFLIKKCLYFQRNVKLSPSANSSGKRTKEIELALKVKNIISVSFGKLLSAYWLESTTQNVYKRENF